MQKRPVVLAFVIALVAALVLHLVFGWEWTIAAGILYGLMVQRLAWLGGAAVGLLSWGSMLLYSYISAPEPMGRMTETVGGLAGGMPAWLVPISVLLLGTILGLLGALIGATVTGLVGGPRNRETHARGESDTTLPPTINNT